MITPPDRRTGIVRAIAVCLLVLVAGCRAVLPVREHPETWVCSLSGLSMSCEPWLYLQHADLFYIGDTPYFTTTYAHGPALVLRQSR